MKLGSFGPLPMNFVQVSFGSKSDEICTDRLLSLSDSKADVEYEETVLRHSILVDRPVSDSEADLANNRCKGM